MSQFSPYQLRLQQIAIWGDAAYNTRNPNSIPFQNIIQQDENPKLGFHISPSLSSSISEDKLSISLSSTSTIETHLQPYHEKRGSFNQCHTSSAQHFRRISSYRSLLLANKRRDEYNHIKTSKSNPNLSQLPQVEMVESDHFILAKRSSLSTKEIKMETRLRGRRSSLRSTFRSKRKSSLQPLVADEIQPIVFDRDSIIAMKQNIHMRERDENQFRNSNAKLPERESTSKKPLRASMPSLGRFTRSSVGQIPNRRPYSTTM